MACVQAGGISCWATPLGAQSAARLTRCRRFGCWSCKGAAAFADRRLCQTRLGAQQHTLAWGLPAARLLVCGCAAAAAAPCSDLLVAAARERLQAARTLALGSACRQASRTASLTPSHSLSGWPSVTLSELKRKRPGAVAAAADGGVVASARALGWGSGGTGRGGGVSGLLCAPRDGPPLPVWRVAWGCRRSESAAAESLETAGAPPTLSATRTHPRCGAAGAQARSGAPLAARPLADAAAAPPLPLQAAAAISATAPLRDRALAAATRRLRMPAGRAGVDQVKAAGRSDLAMPGGPCMVRPMAQVVVGNHTKPLRNTIDQQPPCSPPGCR